MSLSRLEKDIIVFLQGNKEESFSVDQLSQIFNYRGTKNYKKLIKALAFLERIGEIQLTPEGHFKAFSSNEEVVGIYRANEKGFGFVSYEDAESDFFVPRGKNGGAMEGDTVRVRIVKHVNPATGKGSEAQVVEVIDRKASQLVGEFYTFNQDERQSTGYVGYIKPQGEFPDETKIFIRPDGIHPANHTICIVEIAEYPDGHKPNEMVGLVTKEIGHKDAPGVDILAVLFQFGIPHEFPKEVLKESEAVEQTIQPEEIQGRKDLRDQLIITIDGADAKDLDDAISLQKISDKEYHLGVHIADVSHYVIPGSAIDREAYERGTSVYLTDRVVPMLPQRLSNGICSLNPKEDRLSLTCEMVINNQGQVVKHQIYKSVIHSSYRMTYSDVNAILDGDPTLRQDYQEIVPMLEEMAELHDILYQMRRQRGALDFDAPEAKILVDEKGHPTEIVLRERFTSERLIESFMLAANETVAKDYLGKQLPFLYRIHEQPDSNKMDRFAEFISSFGVVLRGNTEDMAPRALQEALKKVKGEDYEQAVSTMMLRSMQQAKYSEEPAGHFGLAADDYTHFTSPIRRYPDLMVHRLISLYLAGKPSNKEISKLEDQLPGIAIHSSKMERRAVDAERETDALKKAEFMMDKVGESFWGTISSVTSFGVFVALPNTVEGLISIQNLEDDYYHFNPDHMLLIGERTHKIFRIGQRVKIQVSSVSVEDRQIDFKLIEAEPVEGIDPKVIQFSTQNKKKGKPRKTSTKMDKNLAGKKVVAKSKSKRTKKTKRKKY
ncbi:ribonuclease R [Facklamia miroungae]|uniref:Ribonuclease R n=1 Tax=Facklamia miroungae TaxID=120956 RepID=A0A1G7U3A3_9LACT|nr:ribonuclease R [Facklamia miroungae]NKZ29874.1 ribonuclease R [Facklamia miroungae]SDG41539.1 ribonuclease R [Facklamia miroungae]